MAALILSTLHRNAAYFRRELAVHWGRKTNLVLLLLFLAVLGVAGLANKCRNLDRYNIVHQDEVGLKWVEQMLLRGCFEVVLESSSQNYRRSLVVEYGRENL